VKTRDIPELKEGDKMEFEIWFEIIGSYMHVDVYYDGEVLKHDTVKIKTVTRPKYIRPNFHRKKQEGNKNWKTAIFSLMK
jgi:hypothetical protein